MGSGAVVVTRWEWGRGGKPEWQKSAFYTHPPSQPPATREKAGLKGQQGWVGSPSGPQGTHRAERGGQMNKKRLNASS